MKNIFLTLIVAMITTTMLSQSQNSHRIKYVIIAPDGSVGTTIYDDYKSNKIILESADAFYKYEILDRATNKKIVSKENKGTYCEIDKRKVNDGAYNIKLYTKNFIITSKVIISEFKQNTTNNSLIAINED